MPASAYVLLLLITAVVSTIVTYHALQRQNTAEARSLAFMMAAITVWSLAYALELESPSLESKLFWAKVQYFGIVSVPYFWLVFALRYTKRAHWLSRRNLALLAVAPALVLLLVWTNDLHGWIWSSTVLDRSGSLVILHSEHGPAFWAFVCYGYLIILVGKLFVFLGLVRQPGVRRKQAGLILFGASLPWIANCLYLMGITPFHSIDLTPFAFALSGFIGIIALVHYRLLEAGAAAYKMVFESLTDGVMVIDAQDYVIDLNQVAAQAVGRPISDLIGRRSAEVFQEWADRLPPGEGEVFRRFVTETQAHQEVFLGEAGMEKTIDLQIIPLKDENGLPYGRIAVWSDLTEERQKDKVLHRQLDELRILRAVATACAESAGIDELVEGITQIVAQALYPDNFGLLMVDRQANLLRFHPSYRGLAAEATSTTIPLGHGLTGHTAVDGKARLVHEVKLEPDYLQLQYSAGSELCVPVKVGEQIVAVINAESSRSSAFSAADERLLVTVAGQLATAMDRLRTAAERLELLVEMQKRLDEVTLLSQAISLTASSEDITSAMQQVCAATAHYFQSPQSAVALLDQAGKSAEVVAEYHVPDRPSAIGITIPVAENPSFAYILENKVPLAIADAQSDPLLAPVQDVMRQREVASILLVPIMSGDQVIGTLGIDDLKRHVFSQADIALMENVARQVGQALERLRLFSTANEQASRMARLAEISGNLSHTSTVEEVLEGIGQGALALSAADRAAIFIRESEDAASCPWHVGLSDEYLEQALAKARDLPGGKLFSRTEPVLIADVSALPDTSLLKCMALNERYQAISLWPLIYAGQVSAAVGCYYNAPHAWSDLQREVLQTFARQAAVALQNARLFEETRLRAFQMETLNAVIIATAVAPDMPSMLESVLSLILRTLDVPSGGIWVGEFSSLHGMSAEFISALASAVEKAGLDTTRTVSVEDWEQIGKEDPLRDLVEIMSLVGVHASLAAPVTEEGRRIGEIVLTTAAPHRWQAEEVALVESVGRQLGSAVERLNLLAKTREQARQMRQIMDTVPEGVLLLDSEQNLLLANPAAWLYLDDLADEVDVGDRLTHLADRPVSDLLKPEEEWFEITTTSPSHHFFEAAAQPLSNDAQNQGWVLVLRDVTQEREYQTRIQIQERLATVGQLAAGIAHDFNNIMAAIFVYTDLIMMEAGLSATNLERLDTIQKQVQRAASLIRQILDFSRRSVMEHSTLDLLPFIKELDKLLGRVLPETIHLELVYHPGSYLVNADPARLQQVFMNLALNARDAMPSGGTLRFTLDRYDLSPEMFPPIPELAVGRWVRIEVADTGAGIPAEIMSHIFEPFFTTKPVGQGTGLGLAQVYGIIKQHEGAIDVYSCPGDGTIFTIYLPALEAQTDEFSLGESGIAEELGAGETVLLVEDDDVAREALRTLLEEQNYKPLTASNGLDALKLLQTTTEPVTLVISDVVMPEMGGIELLQSLQTYHPDLKVLLITGHPLDLENQSVLELGDVHWMQKPFSAQSFNKMVKDLLEEEFVARAE